MSADWWINTESRGTPFFRGFFFVSGVFFLKKITYWKKNRKIIRESQIIFVIHESQLLYELIWKIQDLIRRLERGES
jgi:hypothetical protein